MTPIDERHEGAVLGAVAGMAESPGGDLYVLDRAFHKIVVFARDGSFRRVIVGGYGRGPGEFIRPRAIAVSPAGVVAVLDDAQSRVTLFSPDGTYRAAILVSSRLLLLAYEGERLFGLAHSSHPDQAVVFELDPSLPAPRPVRPVIREESALFGAGSVGGFGRDLAGRLLLASPMVGLWRPVSDAGAGVPGGAPVYPWLRVEEVVREPAGPIRTVLLWVQTVGQLASGKYLVVYTVHPNPPRRRYPDDVGTGHMALVLDERGTVERRYQLFPFEPASAYFTVAGGGKELLVTHFEPYPHVTRYRLP